MLGGGDILGAKIKQGLAFTEYIVQSRQTSTKRHSERNYSHSEYCNRYIPRAARTPTESDFPVGCGLGTELWDEGNN